ncbi:MAG: TnpV protein [Lachnospiraceae bacterium]|nr:TnpV protein [Lachnospiraceae bacterium]
MSYVFHFVKGDKDDKKECALAHSWVYVRQYCAEIDEAARNRMELIVRSLAEQNGVTEQLKAENQMEWVRQMNTCKTQAEEIVKAELIYD